MQACEPAVADSTQHLRHGINPHPRRLVQPKLDLLCGEACHGTRCWCTQPHISMRKGMASRPARREPRTRASRRACSSALASTSYTTLRRAEEQVEERAKGGAGSRAM